MCDYFLHLNKGKFNYSGQTEYLGRTLTSSQRKSYTDITEQFLKNYLKGENCKQNSGWKNKSQDKGMC